MKTMLQRGAGILMPISALPSPYGIGTMGKDAYEFVEQLHRAGQKYWQVLPVGPTSYGDSPYQSFSSFAGNPYFIDLELLAEEGLLEKSYIETFFWGEDPENISYGTIFENRFIVLRKAFQNSQHKNDSEYIEFCEQNSHWLSDYSLYMACKNHFNHAEWLKWEEDIKRLLPEAVKRYRILLAEDIEFWSFCQYKFFEQWKKLKAYANVRGIKIIGDIPIYAALDSVDVWMNPKQFQLDEETLRPSKVAGVPPDAFSEEGQLWGNPLYDWKEMEADHFAWWKNRMRTSANLYDIIRIDHFLGIVRYFSIPGDAVNGKIGEYIDGPGIKFIDAISSVLGRTKIIAEDLGVANPKVKELLEIINYPGMKVLEFAFSGDRQNEHLPHNYTPNMVVYGGTHDNETLAGYLAHLPDWEMSYLMNYLDVYEKEKIIDRMFVTAYASVASVAIFQLQDVLKLGNQARMNFPSTLGSNWKWRMEKGAFGEEHINRLSYLADIYGRR